MGALGWILLLVCFPVFTDHKNITAESGQNVTLTGRAPNNNSIVVEWSRADLGSEYVLVYWDGNFLPEEQHPSFKNRVDLQDRQMKDGDVSLILKDVTVNDTGTYECRVQREDDDNVMLVSIIYLVVVAPPGQPGGSTEDEEEEDGGEEDGGKEDGVSRGRPGLAAGLSVPAVLLVAVVGLLVYRKK